MGQNMEHNSTVYNSTVQEGRVHLKPQGRVRATFTVETPTSEHGIVFGTGFRSLFHCLLLTTN